MNFDKEQQAELDAWYKRYYSNDPAMVELRSFDRKVRKMEVDDKLANTVTDPKTGKEYFYRPKEWNLSFITDEMELELLRYRQDADFHEELERKDDMAVLGIAIKALSREELELLIMLYVENKSQRDVATQYGITQVAVLKRKNMILKKIRKIFQKFGYQTP